MGNEHTFIDLEALEATCMVLEALDLEALDLEAMDLEAIDLEALEAMEPLEAMDHSQNSLIGLAEWQWIAKEWCT